MNKATKALEKRVSKLKMLTGIEAEIKGGKLVIEGKLTQTETEELVLFCRRAHLKHEIIGTYKFVIS